MLEAAEQRTEALMLANRAMHESLSTLSDANELDGLLGRVLATIVEQLGEENGALWLHDYAADLTYLHMNFEAGAVRFREDTDHPGRHGKSNTVQHKNNMLRCERNEPMQFSMERIRVDPEWSEFVDYFERNRVKAVVVIPLFAGERYLGNISIRAQHREAFPSEEIAFAQALANQASLALHIAQLAEEAKQAAIAREQEASTRKRVVELEQANQALSSAFATINRTDDLPRFLEVMLREMIHTAGAQSGAVVLIEGDPPDEVAHHISIITREGVVTAEEKRRQGLERPPFNDALRLYARRIVASDDASGCDPEDALHVGGLREFHHAQGHRFIRNLALRVRGEMIGWLGLGFAQRTNIRPESIGLLRLFADQISMAVELMRLAEEAKQAAIAREQEKAALERVAELAKANDALARSTAELSAEGDLDAYLGGLLRILLQQMETDSGSMWFVDPEGWHRLRVEVIDGDVVPIAVSEHPGARQGLGTYKHGNEDAVKSFKEQSVARRPVVYSDVATEKVYDGDEETRAYLRSNGVLAQLMVPLFSGSRYLGSFSVRSKTKRTWSKEQLELAQALGNQAALAMELTRLADEAKQAAIAREQEKAALERVAELAKANEALRRSVDSLVDLDSIDAFLSVSLQTIAEVLEVPSACFWKTDHEFSHLQLIFEDGFVKPGSESSHPNARTPNKHDRSFSYDENGKLRVDPFVSLVDDPLCPFTDVQRAKLRDIDVRALINIPIMLKGESVATITARLTNSMPDPTPARLELIRALANQAALALQMSELAEAARQTAIAREEERAARKRASESQVASQALQKTIDAAATLINLDDFIPQALTIVARAFGIESVAYFEHPGDTIYLRYWLMDGLIYGPRELSDIDAVQSNVLRKLAGGFAVPVEHLGVHFSNRSTATILDHATASASPEFHTFALSNGWRWELNVPLVVNGRADGALVLFAPPERLFSDVDVSLAESLAKQIALAMKVSDIAKVERDAAVARERVVELAKANEALQRSVDSLVDLESIDAFLGVSLRTIADVLEVPSACFWRQDDEWSHLKLVYQDGRVIPGAESEHPHAKHPSPHDDNFTLNACGDLQSEPYMTHVERDPPNFTQAQKEMFQRLDVRALINIPVILSNRTVATITARLTHSMPDPTPSRLELIRALANQAALAIQMTQLAKDARDTAVAREREQAALDQLSELIRANAAMRECLDEIAAATEMEQLQPSILGSFVRIFRAVGGSLWRFNPSDQSVTLELEFADGTFKSRGESRFEHPEKHFYDPAHTPSFEKHQRLIQGEMLTLDIATTPVFLVNERAHLLSQGVQTLIVIPLAAAGKHLGRLALAFADRHEFSPSECELASTLANQASLIMETTRLADAAKQDAIDREQFRATYEERTRLAREMHDTLLQGFAGISMQLRAIGARVKETDETLRTHVEELAEESTFVIREARRAVGDMRDWGPGDAALLHSLRHCVETEQAKRPDVTLELRCTGQSRPLEPGVRENLFRVAREALRNALQHSQATRIDVELIFEKDTVCLTVSDDGRGFDLNEGLARDGHWGLTGIQERVRRLNGKCAIATGIGKGARISIEVPS